MESKCKKHQKKLTIDEKQQLLEKLEATYDGSGINYFEAGNLPRRQEIISITEKLLEILFPGYNERSFKQNELSVFLKESIEALEDELSDQLCRALYNHCPEVPKHCGCNSLSCVAQHTANEALNFLPELRVLAKLDVKAAFIGDPAAANLDEIILSYPCIKAIAIQRFAHLLYLHKIPFLPRMMTEYAHSITGIDIHPGATLGKSLFIDHGTGVVIGETAVIGDNVRIYQGVTLGALSFPKDACGMLVKGQKRHPTIEDNVIIYAGASVLGDIVVGANSVLGGSVWVTESLEAGTKITAKLPEYSIKLSSKK